MPVSAGPWRRVDLGSDDGQTILLVIGYFLIAATLVLLVADQSRLFLARRAVLAAADGAAQQAAQEVDADALYRSGATGEAVPLDPTGATQAVGEYVAAANGDGGDRLAVVRVGVDGPQVTVVLRTAVRVPLHGLVTGSGRTVVVSATATARSPYLTRPAG